MKWVKSKLSNLIEEFERGISYSSDEIKFMSGIPMLNLACIDKSGFYRDGELKFFSGSYAEKDKVFPGEMLVACTDLTRNADIIGTPIWVPNECDFYLYTMDLAKLTPKPNIDKKFLYYALKTKSYRKYIRPWATGTTVLHLNLRGMYDFELCYPEDINDQKELAQLLSDIDEKISINKQINTNLYKIAKQKYDYWFIQFDYPNEIGKPYKSSGGEMKYDEKLMREIPKDWHCGNLLEIAKFTNGLACQKFRPCPDEESLPVIKIKEMREGITNDTERVKSDIPEWVKVYNGDILFSWSASLEVMLWCYGDGGLNQHIFKVTSANGFPKSFYFYQLLNYVDIFKKIAEARKTTMGHITMDHLKQSTIAIPNNVELAESFGKEVAPIFDMIVNNQNEIISLTKQRDDLIQLLMNGQVSIG